MSEQRAKRAKKERKVRETLERKLSIARSKFLFAACIYAHAQTEDNWVTMKEACKQYQDAVKAVELRRKGMESMKDRNLANPAPTDQPKYEVGQEVWVRGRYAEQGTSPKERYIYIELYSVHGKSTFLVSLKDVLPTSAHPRQMTGDVTEAAKRVLNEVEIHRDLDPHCFGQFAKDVELLANAALARQSQPAKANAGQPVCPKCNQPWTRVDHLQEQKE